MTAAKIRLFVDQPLGAGQTVTLHKDQAHYLFGVMRKAVGTPVLLFNGRDGEWMAEVTRAGKRDGDLECREKTQDLRLPPDVWLLFAPIKKARTDFIVEKATEMGAARIMPVQTDFTNAERIRQPRLQAHAVEAAEQCGGTYVPEVCDLQRLDRLLDAWPPERRLVFADEMLAGEKNAELETAQAESWAILIGPEGGFSPKERERLRKLPFVTQISLGPRILRADTAAVAALTLWQNAVGDW